MECQMLTKQAKSRIVEGLRRALYGPAPKDYRLAGAASGAILGDLGGKVHLHEQLVRGMRPSKRTYDDALLGARLTGAATGYGAGSMKTIAERQAYRRRVVKRTAAGLLGAGGGGAYLATRNKKK
jgi:hypothetical protein